MQISVNGTDRTYDGDRAKPLLWVLRDGFGLTGTKFGCGKDVCGACTVHVDGRPQHACKLTMADVEGRSITTIEGLPRDGAMHPVQEAWVAHDVGQCGYCQPGMIMSASALLARAPKPTEHEVAEAIPNLCRCATYARVKAAVRSVAEGVNKASTKPRNQRDVAVPGEFFTALGDWIEIGSQGATLINISQSEMGQGSSTGLAMLVAEELDCDWERVAVVIATGRDAYRITLLGYHGQFVGGSLSSSLLHERLRKAGANARAALLAAGAARLGVATGDCRTERSRVVHVATGRSVGFGDCVVEAAKLVDGTDAAFKTPDAFRLIGKPLLRLDAEAHVRGSSTFGMDVVVPGMLVGAIRFAGGFGAKIVSVDDGAARAISGVKQIVTLEDSVVVLADGYWEAQRGADALLIKTDVTAGTGLSTDGVFFANRAALSQAKAVTAVDRGTAAPMLSASGASARHSAEYMIPYIAHAAIEPVVATVHIEADKATVWAPTQGQDVIRDRISKLFGMPEAAVTVYTTFIGGGFGRKFVPDFVIQAAFASKASGRPVQLIRSREEDLRHDFYRPGLVARFEAALDEKGYPQALRARIAGQSLLYQMFPMWVVDGVDDATVEGTNDQPYAIPNIKVEMVDVPQIIPMGFLRSVGRSANVFFVESFMDELAEKAGIDPASYRRTMLRDDRRAIAVLDAVVKAASWSSPLGSNRFRGLAYAPYIGRGGHFTTRVAVVVEIARRADGSFSTERVVVAIDPGLVINPNLVRAQVEGCVGFALSSVIKGEITFTDGLVDQTSFEEFRLLTLAEMPDVEVIIVETDDQKPGGVGEAAMPVIGPALASALYAATGQRIRTMPFDKAVPFGIR